MNERMTYTGLYVTSRCAY